METLVRLIMEHKELFAATIVSVFGVAYLYWPSDPFDIREGNGEKLIKGK